MRNANTKSNASNNRGNWNHVKIINKIPEKYREESRNQGTIKNNDILHRKTHTAESTDEVAQNIPNTRNKRTNTLETWFQVYNCKYQA